MQQDGTHDMQGDTVRSKQKRHPYRSRVIAGVLTAAAVLGGTVATHDRSQAVPPPRSTIAQTQHTAAAVEKRWIQTHNFASRYQTVHGIRMHYVVGGTGSPIVLIHGWPETWWEFHKMAPALARHHTVLIPDLPGAGGSGIATSLTGYTKVAMANDIDPLITGLHAGRALVAGHDIGAMVAYAEAVTHRNHVKALALLAVGVPDANFLKFTLLPPRTPGGLGEPSVDSSWKWWFAFHNTVGVSDHLISNDVNYYLNFFFNHHDPGRNTDTEAISDTDRAIYIASYGRPKYLTASLGWYRTFSADVTDNVKMMRSKLHTPLLAMADAIDYPGVAKQASTLSAGSTRLVEIPQSEAGHWLPEQVPGAVNKELLALDARSS